MREPALSQPAEQIDLVALGSLAELAAARLGVAGLEIRASEAWSSSREGSRALLRRQLAEAAGEASDAGLLDLARVPEPRSHAASISHHRERGAFAIAPRSEGLGIGLDIELVHRVRPELVARVCPDRAELSEAPAPAPHWAAKEAAYKALRGATQPRGVADIRVAEWREISPSTFECVALVRGEVAARGVVSWTRDECAALFVAGAGRR